MGTHQRRLSEAFLMSTHNMFLWKNKKNYPRILLLNNSFGQNICLFSEWIRLVHVDFLPCLTKQTTLIFFLLFCTLIHCGKGVYTQGEQIFSFRVDPFSEGGKTNFSTVVSLDHFLLKRKHLQLGI